ncbi:MAG: hypothetical protein HQ546_03030 [Planctomycetes bacterium]|nr:hypothetical protein [Planctomycetota bacterium]
MGSIIDGDDRLGTGDLLVLLGALLGPALLLATGVLLLKKADAISLNYFSHTVLRTEIIIYRIIFAAIGVFLISTAFIKLVTLMANLAIKYFSTAPIQMDLSYFLPWIASALVNLCLGLYFFIGAPHLLGWHLQRCDAVDRKNQDP